MTRSEHLAWCKQRALTVLEDSGVSNAFASMANDLQKHEGTANHSGVMLGAMMLAAGQLRTTEDMRRFIEGFN